MTDPTTTPAAAVPTRSAWRIFRRVLKWVLFILLGLAGLILSGGTWPIEIAWFLLAGWIYFALENARTIELNPALFVEGIACTIALGIGAHYFCRWLYDALGASARRAWRWQWTASGLALVMLLFVAGIGTIGVTHQAAWLFNAKVTILESSWGVRSRISEALLAGAGFKTTIAEFYAETGRLPRNLEDLGISASPDSPTGVVANVIIRDPGVIVVILNQQREWPEGGELTLTPTADPAVKKLSWKCRSTLPDKLIVAQCRKGAH